MPICSSVVKNVELFNNDILLLYYTFTEQLNQEQINILTKHDQLI